MEHRWRHFGVYSLIMSADRRQLLLVRKATGPYLGRFDLPGGTPEGSESPLETLRREVLEETGCTVQRAEYMGTYSRDFHYQENGEWYCLDHCGVIYRAQIQGTPREDADGHDSLGSEWVDVHILNEQNATPLLLEALRQISS